MKMEGMDGGIEIVDDYFNSLTGLDDEWVHISAVYLCVIRI